VAGGSGLAAANGSRRIGIHLQRGRNRELRRAAHEPAARCADFAAASPPPPAFR